MGELTQEGDSNKRIAWELGRSTSTIGRGLKRNYGYGAWSYDGERAQRLSEGRRQNSKISRISKKVWEEVFEVFNLDYSPEQIASVVKVSHESIYRRIYAEIKAGQLDRKHLRWEQKNNDDVYQNDRLEILRNSR